MGMNGVELVIAVEEAFDIQVSDAEATGVETMGDLHALVMAKTAPEWGKQCLSAWVFRKLRRALVESGVAERGRIRPGETMESLLPARKRRDVWPMLAARSELMLPELERPKGLSLVATTAVFGLAAAVGIGVGLLLESGGAGVSVGFVSLPVLALVAAVATKPFAVHLRSCPTAREWARTTLAMNYGKAAKAAGLERDDEVWRAIRRLVAHQFKLREADLRREVRVWDLSA